VGCFSCFTVKLYSILHGNAPSIETHPYHLTLLPPPWMVADSTAFFFYSFSFSNFSFSFSGKKSCSYESGQWIGASLLPSNKPPVILVEDSAWVQGSCLCFLYGFNEQQNYCSTKFLDF
jgi:hypothetical protein